MTVEQICAALEARVFVPGKGDKEVSSVSAGDLLSYVMGTAQEGALWVTIQTHLNVAAVAVLKDIPLILLAAGRQPAPDLAARCAEEGICLAGTDASLYGACARLASLGLPG